MKSRLRHPIRAIREPFGTAGVVIAVIALVAALGGTALAAAKLNGTQKKEVEKIAKKFAGKPGAPGAAGTNGTNGKDGTTGTAGTAGAPGKSVTVSGSSSCAEGGITVGVEGSATTHEVCNGEEGEEGEAGEPGAIHPGESLPEGATETGTWAFNGQEADGEEILAPVSFPIPLHKILNEEHVHFQGEAGFATHCPAAGVSGPEAKAGELCIYSNVNSEPDALLNATFKGAFKPTDLVEPGSGKSGAILRFAFSGAPGGVAHGFGSWAVTAPAE
jgi:hypothetical protein